MCIVKTQKHRFPFIIISIIVLNDTRIPQNQHCFSMHCLFVLISHHFKPLRNKNKLRAN